MIETYKRLKAMYPDALLLFLNGDFYQLYFEDAVAAGKLLGLRVVWNGLSVVREPPGGVMLNLPRRVSEQYLKRLVEAGKRLVIVEQNR